MHPLHLSLQQSFTLFLSPKILEILKEFGLSCNMFKYFWGIKTGKNVYVKCKKFDDLPPRNLQKPVIFGPISLSEVLQDRLDDLPIRDQVGHAYYSRRK